MSTYYWRGDVKEALQQIRPAFGVTGFNSIAAEGDLGIKKFAYFLGGANLQAAILTQPLFHLLANAVVGWAEETDGSFDLALGTGNPVEGGGNKCIKLTQTAAAGGKMIYYDFASSVDWSFYDYLGFWYQAGEQDDYDAGDLKIGFMQGKTAWADVSASYNFNPEFVESTTTAVWKYHEIDLTGYSQQTRHEVTRLAINSLAGTNGNFLQIAQLVFYKFGTGLGPATGLLRRLPVTSGSTFARGDYVKLESGRGEVAAADDSDVIGIAINPSHAIGDEAFASVAGNDVGGVIVDFVQGPADVILEAAEALTALSGVQPASKDTVDSTASTATKHFAIVKVNGGHASDEGHVLAKLAACCQGAVEGA